MFARSTLGIARRSAQQAVAINRIVTPTASASTSTSRLLHVCAPPRQGAKPKTSHNDAAEGVDPGYTTTEETRTQPPPAEPKPSNMTDPFPLPFDPRLQGMSLASNHQSEGLGDASQEPIPLRVPGRDPGQESRETKVARLIYQTRKRGTLETDILLSTFAKRELKALSDQEVDEFDRLLDEPDWDIFYWMTDRKPVVDRWKESFATEGRLGWRLRKHARNEEREQRFMPDL